MANFRGRVSEQLPVPPEAMARRLGRFPQDCANLLLQLHDEGKDAACEYRVRAEIAPLDKVLDPQTP